MKCILFLLLIITIALVGQVASQGQEIIESSDPLEITEESITNDSKEAVIENTIPTDFDILRSLHGNLEDTHSFYYQQAIDLIDQLDDKSMLSIPLPKTQMSILHHLLAFYFQNDQNGYIRKGVVQVMKKLVEANVDVDESHLTEPSALFKSIVLRELDLASVLAKETKQFSQLPSLRSSDSEAYQRELTQIFQLFKLVYSVPCGVVPIVKLLLHADTVVHNNKGISVDAVKQLLLSANNPSAGKSNIKAQELIDHSPTFLGILSRLVEKQSTATAAGIDIEGNIESVQFVRSDQGFTLDEIIVILDEISAKLHSNMLEGFTTAPSENVQVSLTALLDFISYNDSSRRNVLHHVCMSRASKLLSHFTNVIAMVNDQESDELKDKLRGAFLAKDIREQLPYHYAVHRYGIESSFFQDILKLYSELGIPIDVEQLRQESPHVSVNDDNLDKRQKHAIVDEAKTGGWSVKKLSNDYIATNQDRCDLEELWLDDSHPITPEEFYQRYVRTGTPVVLRNAISVDSKLRTAFAKESFAKRYGKVNIAIAEIPYANSFGRNATAIKVKELVDIEEFSSEIPNYAFTTAGYTWRSRLHKDAAIPDLIVKNQITGQELSLEDGSVECQFYLGPAGSGAPVHYHGHAVNSLAYGEKKWFIYPPSTAFYSTTPAYDFLLHDDRKSFSMQCTQYAGDMMYVPPLWGHATLNTMQSIGVAHEFSLESFCME